MVNTFAVAKKNEVLICMLLLRGSVETRIGLKLLCVVSLSQETKVSIQTIPSISEDNLIQTVQGRPYLLAGLGQVKIVKFLTLYAP